MKSKLSLIIKYVIIFILLITLYIGTLSLVALIPRAQIKNNLRESSNLLIKETNVYKVDIGNKIFFLDNYTNALMLNHIYSQDEREPIKSAILVKKNYLPNINQKIYEDTQQGLKSASKYSQLNQVGELKDTLDENIMESFEYVRYWHGYIVIFKILFLFFNLSQIRNISLICIWILIFLLLYLIYKKLKLSYAIVTAISFILLDLFILGVELQGQLVIYVLLITSIYIFITYKNNRSYIFLFFIVGSLTNFLDFFTTPIITLYIPLIFYYQLLSNNKEVYLKEIIKIIFINSFLWFCGYAFTWGMKWILADIIFNRNIIKTAINQIIFRGYSPDTSYLDTIILNFASAGNYMIFITGVLIIYNFIVLIKRRIKNKNYNLNYNVFFIIISLIPFIWYLLTENHAHEHSYFTYKNLLVLTLSQFFLFINNYNTIKNKK